MSRWLPFPGKRQALQSKGWETTSPQGFGCEQVPTQALGFPHALKIPGENEAQGEHQLQSQLWRGCKATIVFTKTAPLGVAPPKLWPQDKEPHISQNPKHIFKAQGWDQPASHPGSPPHQEMFLRESMAISCCAWTQQRDWEISPLQAGVTQESLIPPKIEKWLRKGNHAFTPGKGLMVQDIWHLGGPSHIPLRL